MAPIPIFFKSNFHLPSSNTWVRYIIGTFSQKLDTPLEPVSEINYNVPITSHVHHGHFMSLVSHFIHYQHQAFIFLTFSQDFSGQEEVRISYSTQLLTSSLIISSPRLDEALALVRASPLHAPEATFTLQFSPFQVRSDLPETADKKEWYLHNMHLDNADAQKAYERHMTELFKPLDITLNFDGTLGNTFQAHRVIQHFQDVKDPETVSRLVNAIFMRYLTEAKHPAADETLIESCIEAGIGEDEARTVVKDKGLDEAEVKQKIREISLDYDAVPVVMFEGKRRDITVRGAKDVTDYIKAMETVIKESK